MSNSDEHIDNFASLTTRFIIGDENFQVTTVVTSWLNLIYRKFSNKSKIVNSWSENQNESKCEAGKLGRLLCFKIYKTFF